MIQINAAALAVWHGKPLARKAAMSRRPEHHPTDKAPASGNYELLNIFGTPTGETVTVNKGDSLPASARGYRWRLIEAPVSTPPPADVTHPALAALPAPA
jgi:hypothetical protein